MSSIGMTNKWRGLVTVVFIVVLIGDECQSVLPGKPRIKEHPENIYAARNTPAKLRCSAEGNPKPKITWYRNGVYVRTAVENTQSRRMILPDGSLFFLMVVHSKNDKPDAGTYYCNATNKYGTAISRNATFDIAVLREDFRTSPRDTDVAVGAPILLECKPPRGHPEPRVSWTKDGNTVKVSGRVRIQAIGSLLISSSRKTDSGTYVCSAKNQAGERHSSPARVSVLERPRFTRPPPAEKIVDTKTNVEFICQAIGDPRPTLTWRKEDGQLPKGRSRILTDNTLRIDRTEVMDEGTYICEASNAVGPVYAKTKLTVRSHPAFVMTPRDTTVGVGKSVSFHCGVTGNPMPTVYWNKEDNTKVLYFANIVKGRFRVYSDGTLRITNVERSDVGNYVCHAVSVAGNAFTKASLKVVAVDPRPPPTIIGVPHNQTLPMNSQAQLICIAEGDPPPTIKWYKDNKPILAKKSRYHLQASGTLQIENLKMEDSGMYTCKAVSDSGENSISAGLQVRKNPSNPFPVQRRIPAYPAPPSKPNIKDSDITHSSIKLSWTYPKNARSSKVTSFRVEYFSHETGEGWTIASKHVRKMWYVVRGLQPGTSYMFIVRARNNVGQFGNPCKVSDLVRTKGPENVGISNSIRAMAERNLKNDIIFLNKSKVLSSTQFKVIWKVKKARNYIEGFHIRYKEASRKRSVNFDSWFTESVHSSFSTEYILKDLKKWTRYEIKIQPFFLNILGKPSNSEFTRTFEDVPSVPPINIVAKQLKNHSILVTWEPPPLHQSNGVIVGYKVFCIAADIRYNKTVTVDGKLHSVIVKDIIKDMKYRVKVAAFTREGLGKTSAVHVIGSQVKGILDEPWFLPTLIGCVGGALWVLICIFSIWLYRRRRNRKKFMHGGMVSVPVHKSGDPNRQNLFADIVYRQCPIGDNHHPDITNTSDSGDTMNSVRLYDKPNGISYTQTTIVNANNVLNKSEQSAFKPIQQGYIEQLCNGSSDSCIKPPGVTSSDSNTDNSRPNTGNQYEHSMTSPHTDTSDTITDEYGRKYRRPSYDTPKLPVFNLGDFLPPPPEHPPPTDIDSPPDSPTLTRCSSPGSRHSGRMYMAGGQSYPKHGPMSPQGHGSSASLRNNMPRDYSDHDSRHSMSGREASPHSYMYDRRNYSPRTNLYPHHLQNRPREHSPRSLNDRRSQSERSASENERGPTPPVRAYKLVPITDRQGQREGERGPTPPVRMYAIHSPHGGATGSPALDQGYGTAQQNDLDYDGRMHHSHYGGGYNNLDRYGDHNYTVDQTLYECSDNGHYGVLEPMDYDEQNCMDRGIQSSLPSLAGECIHSPMSARLQMTDDGPHLTLDTDHYRPETPQSDSQIPDYAAESDMEPPGRECDCNSPVSSMGDGEGSVSGSMMASWASVITDDDTCISSARSSAISCSSDGSFFNEADFASAVAKAAELSGLTVVGSTITDNKAGKRPKYRYRDRPRASSPYSTDSNFSAVAHKPYPKSQRKRQIQAQANKNELRSQNGRIADNLQGYRSAIIEERLRSQLEQQNSGRPQPPPVKAKPVLPSNVADFPSYSRPNFPIPEGITSPSSTNSRSSSNQGQQSIGTASQQSASTPGQMSTPEHNSHTTTSTQSETVQDKAYNENTDNNEQNGSLPHRGASQQVTDALYSTLEGGPQGVGDFVISACSAEDQSDNSGSIHISPSALEADSITTIV